MQSQRNSRIRSRPRAPRVLLALLLAAGLLVLFAGTAQAYVDPGSGALVVQALIAAVLGAGITLRRSLRRVLERIGLVAAAEKAPETREPRDVAS